MQQGRSRRHDGAEGALLHRGYLLYKQALQDCRRTRELRSSNLGRFVCPGSGSDAPYLWFFPLYVGPSETFCDRPSATIP